METAKFHSAMEEALDFLINLGDFISDIWVCFPDVLQVTLTGLFVLLVGYSLIVFIFKLLV